MADDDDVSEIEVSDDEESPNKHAATATGQPARPPNADSSSHHGSSGSKYGKAGSAEGGSRSRDRRNGRHQGHNAAGRVDETLYEDDEEGHAAEDGYEVAGDEAYDDFEDEEEGHDGQAGDRFDEEALDYFYSRKRAGQAPKTWLEVDEGEIREVSGDTSGRQAAGSRQISGCSCSTQQVQRIAMIHRQAQNGRLPPCDVDVLQRELLGATGGGQPAAEHQPRLPERECASADLRLVLGSQWAGAGGPSGWWSH